VMRVVVPADGELSPADRVALAAEIVMAYVAVRAAQRGRPLPDAIRRLRGVAPRRTGVPDEVRVAKRLGRAVVRTISPIPGDSRCLVRSLVLTRLLAIRGLESSLVIGVTESRDFEAHAWVELGGIPVLDPGLGRFERLTEL
jgi:hypothetical protein